MPELQVNPAQAMLDEKTEPEIVCPSCCKITKKIIVDMNRIDWASILFVGFAAVLFPSLARKELQCEHCGKIFLTSQPSTKKSDRLIGFILAGFSLLMIGLVIWIVFFGMKGSSQ
jgi:hypothetical protein